jgi:phospholipase/carboxylesterase
MSDTFETVMEADGFHVHRMPIEFSSYCAVQEPDSMENGPPPLLIAFHGYGQSCQGFIRNFQSLKDKGILVAAPQGVNQFYWENKRPGFCWMTSHMREFTIRDNMTYVARMMGEIDQKYTFDDQRIFLLGFSQGVAMAFRFGSLGMVDPKGVIACGGDLPPDVEEQLGDMEPFPALVVHGKQDSVVPPEKSEECIQSLQRHGFDVESHFFEGEHDIPQAQMDFIWNWIEQRL